MIDQLHADLTSAVARFRRANHLPGISAAVVVGEELAWSANVGYADLEHARRPASDTLYRIASITKTFTATAIIQLRDEGRIDLDDPLVLHIPEFVVARNPFGPIGQVTLRRLLRHTSGLQGEVPVADPRRPPIMTRPEILASLDRTAVVIPPDTANKYSNLGFFLLGEVVRRVGGREYGAYVRDEILAPLRMTSTTLEPAGQHAARRATGYDRWDVEERLHVAEPIGDDDSEGDGGLWSTVEDLARWLAQQFRTAEALERGPGQILAGGSLAEMHRPAFVAEPDLRTAQGLGWRMTRRGDSVFVGHGGFLAGFTSRVEFSSKDRVGVVVLTNGIGYPKGASDLAGELLDLVVSVERRVRAAADTDPAPPTPEAWVEPIGWYRDLESGAHIRVEARSDGLVYVDDLEGDVLDLSPTEDPLVFRFRDGRPAGESLRFLRGPNGAIDALNAAGYPMTRLSKARRS